MTTAVPHAGQSPTNGSSEKSLPRALDAGEERMRTSRHVDGGAPSEPAIPLPELPRRGTRERRALDAFVRLTEKLYDVDIDARLHATLTQRNEAGYDSFGYDPDVARYALATIIYLHRTYFRTEVSGLENVPDGRAVFVSNHSGHIPIDGVLIVAALTLDRDPPILPRAMVEKWAQRLPFFSVLFPRIGQVLGSPDNARRLLEAENPLLVFPEGIRGISKPFSERYKLAPFGLGFMRLALESRAPIVPVAVVGGEEQYPAIGNLRPLAKLLRMPVFPIIPHVMLGVPLPLPTKYRIYFGEPVVFQGDADDEDGDVQARVEIVRESIQSMLGRGLAARKHVFW
jgi:1-acyl-sn-glycerol-3-phosphate acyltransferase